MIDELFESLIMEYASTRKRVVRINDEVELFTAFYLQTIETLREEEDKYIQYKTLGLAFIQKNKSQFYKRIREAIRIIHSRGKNNQGFFTSEAFRSRRRWPRRLV